MEGFKYISVQTMFLQLDSENSSQSVVSVRGFGLSEYVGTSVLMS